MLKQRVITALILGPAIILAVFKLQNDYLAILFGVISLIGAWEWAVLIGLNHFIKKLIYVTLVGAMMVSIWFLLGSLQANMILLLASLWWVAVIVLVVLYQSSWIQTSWLQNVLVYSGFIVLVPCWLALTLLHKHSAVMLMFFLALIWIADIGAYFVGKRFGKIKLAAELSPGKSREGVIGALIASIVFACVGVYLFSIQQSMWLYFIILCAMTAIISVVGDLYESLLKRKAGAKDSGTILPGHGGILDRIDSLTAAAPGYLLGLNWVFL